MFFIMKCRDKENSVDLRLATRPAHLAWIDQWSHIRLGGPFFADDGTTMIGSFAVVEMESIKAVRDWAAQDPYAKAGLFASVDIHPWKMVKGKIAS